MSESDNGLPTREKRCWYCGETVEAIGIPCGHGIYWRAKCPEHGWEPKPFSLEKTLAKIRWVLSRLGWSP